MDCSWELYFKPVEGWKAQKVVYTYNDNGATNRTISYDVIDCPLFIPPGPNYKKPAKHQDKAAYRKARKGVKVTGRNVRTGEVKVWEKMSLVVADGFNPGKVSDCVNGRMKSHKGWVFSKVPVLGKEKMKEEDRYGRNSDF